MLGKTVCQAVEQLWGYTHQEIEAFNLKIIFAQIRTCRIISNASTHRLIYVQYGK